MVAQPSHRNTDLDVVIFREDGSGAGREPLVSGVGGLWRLSSALSRSTYRLPRYTALMGRCKLSQGERHCLRPQLTARSSNFFMTRERERRDVPRCEAKRREDAKPTDLFQNGFEVRICRRQSSFVYASISTSTTIASIATSHGRRPN